MNDDQKVAYVHAQSVCALARLYAMMSENQMRSRRGESPAYVEKDFENVPVEFGIHHNAVLELFRR